MGTREGYKVTEVGVIPEEWGIHPFYDCVDIINGLVSPLDEPYIDYPHIGPGNVEKFTGRIVGYKTARQEHLTSGKYLFDESDILYGKINPQLGKVAFPKFTGVCSADMYPIKAKKEIAFPNYIYYSLQTPRFLEYSTSVSTRTGIPKINRDELSYFKFVLPPLPEQHKIADILSTVDAHVSETEALIDNTQVLRKGLMKYLMTKGIDHTEYNETDVGLIPAEWDVVPFANFVYFQEGPGLRKWQYTESGIPFINIRCIKNNKIDKKDIQYISLDEYEKKYKHFSLNTNDIVVSSSGTLGRKAIIRSEDLPIMLNTSIIRMRPIDLNRLCSSFLSYFIDSEYYQRAVTVESTGSAQLNYGPYHLNRILLFLPSIEEQKRISEILSSVDDQIDTYQTKLASLTKLKSALMQQLLTGKIRVKV